MDLRDLFKKHGAEIVVTLLLGTILGLIIDMKGTLGELKGLQTGTTSRIDRIVAALPDLRTKIAEEEAPCANIV